MNNPFLITTFSRETRRPRQKYSIYSVDINLVPSWFTVRWIKVPKVLETRLGVMREMLRMSRGLEDCNSKNVLRFDGSQWWYLWTRKQRDAGVEVGYKHK